LADRVFVEGLKIFARHGVFEEERRRGQTFAIDISCELDPLDEPLGDDLSSTVNYGELSDIAAEVFAGGPYNLVETLAERIATAILDRFPRVFKARVKVAKTLPPIDALADAVGAEVLRARRASVALSLGSNIGDKAKAIRRALDRLERDPRIALLAASRLFRTAPWGKTDQDWFINACALIETSLPPEALLKRLKVIERQVGRTSSVRWGPRVIDIDIVDYAGRTLRTPSLTLPHPEALNRPFVMIPLADVAADRLIAGRRVGDVADAMRAAATDVFAIDEASGDLTSSPARDGGNV